MTRRLPFHRGGALVTNMKEGKDDDGRESEAQINPRRLMISIFWNPIGIQFAIAIIAVSIGFILKQLSII